MSRFRPAAGVVPLPIKRVLARSTLALFVYKKIKNQPYPIHPVSDYFLNLFILQNIAYIAYRAQFRP